MFHPNRRYGNPAELRAYASGMSVRDLSWHLRRHPRTIRDWLDGRRPIPWWAPELMRLRHETALRDLRQMGCAGLLRNVAANKGSTSRKTSGPVGVNTTPPAATPDRAWPWHGSRRPASR